MQTLSKNNPSQAQHYVRWTLYSVLIGLLAGCAATIFLYSLDWATRYRDQHSVMIWALPLVGFLIGWIYHHYGKESSRGHNLILDEIHDPRNIIPLRMAPLIFISTVLTHLFGGSAGREGTAVQMGASLADQLSRFFRIESAERKILLIAGAGAGFGAAIGTPWAGVIFGMEVVHVGRLRWFAGWKCFVASFVAYFVTKILSAPHTIYPKIVIPDFSLQILFYVAIAGIVFGISAKLFTIFVHTIEKMQAKVFTYAPLKPLFGGILLVLLYALEGSYRYVGLGLSYIQEAFLQVPSVREPFLKALFTGLTLGSGFKGGEFIPLVFIGATLSSILSQVLPISFPLLAALGFAAVFAGASNAPIACSLMAIEIFGFGIVPYAMIACFMSYFFSGNRGIYPAQRIKRKKQDVILSVVGRWTKPKNESSLKRI